MALSEDEYKRRIAKAMLDSQAGSLKLAGYPADVEEVIRVVCELWHLRPPRAKKSKAYWIASARELLDACGEFPVEIVRGYRRRYEQHMRTHNGIAPFTVEGPGSLVKAVRAYAGEERSKIEIDDRRRYVTGELSEWIEH